MVTFFFGRICTVPYMYWRYSEYAKISFIKSPLMIPLHCNITCMFFLLLQLYWFRLIVLGVLKHLYGSLSKKRVEEDKANNGSIGNGSLGKLNDKKVK